MFACLIFYHLSNSCDIVILKYNFAGVSCQSV